jgi:hypothetical protein
MYFSKVAMWLSRFVAGPSVKIIPIQTQFTNQIHFKIFSLSWDKRQQLVLKLRRSVTTPKKYVFNPKWSFIWLLKIQ